MDMYDWVPMALNNLKSDVRIIKKKMLVSDCPAVGQVKPESAYVQPL
jgi:hypothetical protein